MAVTTMEPMELLRKADSADVDFLREGVRVLAQALMDAEVSAQVGAEHGQRAPQRTTHRNGYRPGTGTPGSARSTWPCPGSARAATCPASSSPAGGPSGRWPRSSPSATSRASRPGGSRTSPRPWASPACRSPRSRGFAPNSTSWWRRGATGRWTPARTRSCGWTRWWLRSARRAGWSTPPRWSPPASTPTATARSSAWSWARPRTARPGRASCAAWSPAALPASSWSSATPTKAWSTPSPACWTARPGSGAAPISCATCWSGSRGTPSRWSQAWSARSSPSSGPRTPGPSSAVWSSSCAWPLR